MTAVITHNKIATLPDQPGVEVNKAEWNDSHAITGTMSVAQGGTGLNSFTANGILFASDASTLATSANLTFGGAAAGIGLSSAAGIATTDVPAANFTGAFNNAGLIFSGAIRIAITDTASSGGSIVLSCKAGVSGTTNVFSIGNLGASTFGLGAMILGGFKIAATSGRLYANSDTSNGVIFGASETLALSFLSANSLAIGTGGQGNFDGGLKLTLLSQGASGATAGKATTVDRIVKSVTGIADNAATAVLTGTVPNAAHSAGGKIIVKVAAGAGGAIGADEFTALIEHDWLVTRTAGANAAASLSAGVITTLTGSVAGGATPTLSVALSAVSGAVGATNTFTFNVTAHAGSGSSTNHVALIDFKILNDNANGVTFA